MVFRSEKEHLQAILDSFDEKSKISKDAKFQKVFLSLSFLISILFVIVAHKFKLVSIVALFLVSGFSGMSLMGFIIAHKTAQGLYFIKPYIDFIKIKSRIGEL